MIDPEREELLSAFLDGEVSPEERARVEQWLAESSELRQMRDELLSLRTDLQALPRHQVGHDLAAVVMHRSATASVPEQSSRTAPAVNAPATKDSSVGNRDSSLGNVVAEWWNRGSQGRRFFWPALAVAAALAILVFDARQRPADSEFEVAQAPQAAPAEPQEEAKQAYGASAEQPSMMAAPEPPMPEAGAPPAADSSLQENAPAPYSRSAETRSPVMQQKRDFFNSEPDSVRGGPTRGAAPANSPDDSPKLGRAMDAQREELYAKGLAVETIFYPVTRRYLEDRQFEKLLDANQIRWDRVPIPPQLQMPATPQSSGAKPLESLGKNPVQSLYFLHVKSEQVDGILSQVPQADRLMAGNRLTTGKPQRQLKVGENNDAADGVQIMLVAPVDGAAPAVSPPRPSR